jgi:hypothetical protein
MPRARGRGVQRRLEGEPDLEAVACEALRFRGAARPRRSADQAGGLVGRRRARVGTEDGVSEPLDLSDRERVTCCLAGAATADDLDLRLAYVGAARAALARIERDVAGLRDMVNAAEAEAARLARAVRASKGPA